VQWRKAAQAGCTGVQCRWAEAALQCKPCWTPACHLWPHLRVCVPPPPPTPPSKHTQVPVQQGLVIILCHPQLLLLLLLLLLSCSHNHCTADPHGVAANTGNIRGSVADSRCACCCCCCCRCCWPAAIITAQPTLTADGFDTMYQVSGAAVRRQSYVVLMVFAYVSPSCIINNWWVTSIPHIAGGCTSWTRRVECELSIELTSTCSYVLLWLKPVHNQCK
jgi:hypothetical protein